MDNLEEVSLGFQPANPWCLTSWTVLWWIWNITHFQVRRRKIATLIWNTFWMPAAPINLAGVLESDKRLRLFWYSLNGRARDWLDVLPSDSIETWDQLKREFLDRYFPTAKYLARKKEISSFKQQEGEVLYDAWERFKLLLKRCPGHKL